MKKIPWGNNTYEVVEHPTPHILLDAFKVKPNIPGRWGLKSDNPPKACTMEVLHLSAYKGCTINCRFCSLPQYRGYGLLMHQYGVSVVFENYDQYVREGLSNSAIVHTFDFGADADAFMSLNNEYQLTEKTMSVLNDFGVPFTVTSKAAFTTEGINQLKRNPDNWAQISIYGEHQMDRIVYNMKLLTAAGIKVTARIQPYIPGFSPPIPSLIELIKDLGFSQVVFGILRAPNGKGKKLLEHYSMVGSFDLVNLYSESMPGYKQLNKGTQDCLLNEVKKYCELYQLPLGLCDEYQKQFDGSIVSLQSKYGTCESCECVNSYAYVQTTPGKFKKVSGCSGNCLSCTDNKCGVPEFAASIRTDIKGYQKLLLR